MTELGHPGLVDRVRLQVWLHLLVGGGLGALGDLGGQSGARHEGPGSHSTAVIEHEHSLLARLSPCKGVGFAKDRRQGREQRIQTDTNGCSRGASATTCNHLATTPRPPPKRHFAPPYLAQATAS
jgi:hypothetical protein